MLGLFAPHNFGHLQTSESLGVPLDPTELQLPKTLDLTVHEVLNEDQNTNSLISMSGTATAVML